MVFRLMNQLLITLLILFCANGAMASSVFSYQGHLQRHGQDYSGDVEMEFRLFDQEADGHQVGAAISQTVTVTESLFQVDLDFGGTVFETSPSGTGWWLQVTVAGLDLSPRQAIIAAPFALRGAANRFASGTGKAIGAGSTAMGSHTTSSGYESTAIGVDTTASGTRSMALGIGSVASNSNSIALGRGVRADGSVSTAMGANTRALGPYSVAMGLGTKAYANHMTAIGAFNAPTGQIGSSAFDRPALVVGNGGNEDSRSYAMYLLFNGYMRIAGSLAQNSDRNVKHGIVAVEPLEILQKLSQLEISSWRYDHSPDALHIGPMAQDFHAVFGVGEDDTSISSIDTGGISLAAIQGVHELVQRQRDRIAALEARIEAQSVQLDDLKKQLTNDREATDARLPDSEER